MKLAIVAPAKSGSTAVYNSCRAALSRDGMLCRSIFEPQLPRPILRLRNYDYSRPFVTKVMMSRMLVTMSDFHLGWFDKRILLVRDLKDLMVSELLFRPMVDPLSLDEAALSEFVRLIQEKELNPASISIIRLHERANQLGVSFINWDLYRQILNAMIELRSKYEFSVIHFEDYSSGDYSGLRQIIGREVESTDLSSSWVSHIQRRGKHGDWRNWFTPEDLEFSQEFFKEYNNAFNYGSSGLGELHSATIDNEHGSKYIMRKFKARREQAELLRSSEHAYKSEEDIMLLISRARDGSVQHIRKLFEKYSEGNVPARLIRAEEVDDLKRFGEILSS
jgi:hypothetical protein